MCELAVDGFSWSPPGRALQADTMRKLVVLQDVVLQSAFPELLPAGASSGPPPLVWCQLRPTDRAMAARSARTSSSEEESRLSDDEERLLTKRSMANTSLWKNTCLGVERLKKKQIFHDPDGDLMETILSLSVLMIGRGALRCKKRDLRSSKDAEACNIAVQRRSSK